MFNVDGTSDISFIIRDDFWNMEASGDYAADCRRGREAASELQRHIFFNDTPKLLGSVARAIVHKGHWGGVEIGFFQQIAESFTGGAGLRD